MVGSGSTILLLALVLPPQIKASDNLAQTFLITAGVFVVIGAVLFTITFVTARETVIRDVPQVTFRQTIQTVKKNGPLPALPVVGVLPHRPEHHLGAGHLHRQRPPQPVRRGNWLATVVTGVGMALLNTMTWALEADTVE